MTKTMTTDLAATLSQAQQEEQAAAALEAQAAEQRAKAAAAATRAHAEQEAAKHSWAEDVLAAYDTKRAEAGNALSAAERAFLASVDTPETIISTWMARQGVRAKMYGIEHARRQAATISGHAGVHREPQLPRPTFPEDVAKLLHDWGMGLLSAEEEAVRESLTSATTGREASRAK